MVFGFNLRNLMVRGDLFLNREQNKREQIHPYQNDADRQQQKRADEMAYCIKCIFIFEHMLPY
jgi:hypothetical protein